LPHRHLLPIVIRWTSGVGAIARHRIVIVGMPLWRDVHVPEWERREHVMPCGKSVRPTVPPDEDAAVIRGGEVDEAVAIEVGRDQCRGMLREVKEHQSLRGTENSNVRVQSGDDGYGVEHAVAIEVCAHGGGGRRVEHSHDDEDGEGERAKAGAHDRGSLSAYARVALGFHQCDKLSFVPGFLRVAILAAGVAVLVALVSHEGSAVIAGMLWQIGWGFAVMTALRTAYVALRAGALWCAIPRGKLPYSELWWIRLSTEAVEMVTFTGPFLAEPAKGWLLTRRGLSTAEAVAFVTLENLLYTMVTAWVTAAALCLLLARSGLPEGVRIAALSVLAVIAIFMAAMLYAAISGRGLIAPSIRRLGNLSGRDLGASLAARSEPAEQLLVTFLRHNPREVVQMLGLQLAAQASVLLEVIVVFRALQTGARLVDVFVFEGSVKFIDVAFFFVPGQLGAHEGLYSVIAGALGIATAAGLTLALARRIRGLLVACLAAFARSDVFRRVAP
jgi:hypothetical protein